MTDRKTHPHLCQAMLGEPENFDLSRLLERDEIPMMAGPKVVTWAIVIKGDEPQLREPVKLTYGPRSVDESIRLTVFFCPWCGDRLRRET